MFEFINLSILSLDGGETKRRLVKISVELCSGSGVGLEGSRNPQNSPDEVRSRQVEQDLKVRDSHLNGLDLNVYPTKT